MADPNQTPNPDIEQPEETPQETGTVPVMITISEDEFNKVKEEAREYKDKYLRSLAEGENLRKRLQKERQEMIQYAVQNVVVDFLNPIDQFENALRYALQGSEEVRHWALGFQMILTQFKDVLANNGVMAFQSEGTQFDPHCHEAVEAVETNEHPVGTIVSESVRGYKMGGKTIRPARVKVAKKVGQQASGEGQQSPQQENKS